MEARLYINLEYRAILLLLHLFISSLSFKKSLNAEEYIFSQRVTACVQVHSLCLNEGPRISRIVT